MIRLVFCILLVLTTGRAFAEDAARTFSAQEMERLSEARIVIAGEVHDNPAHHAVQAEIARLISPRALVFEQLTEDQASHITPETRASEDSLRRALEWEESGWPDFSMYYPIFAAAPEAAVYPALVPRGTARAAMDEGLPTAFGPEAQAYGLTDTLDPAEQADREALQAKAHCGALPEDMLPAMVAIQRLRDAVLAGSALKALKETGGPVLVITGNGHARADWGMPVFLDTLKPTLDVVTVGQGENGTPPAGRFDILTDAPAPDRDDPCAAFQ